MYKIWFKQTKTICCLVLVEIGYTRINYAEEEKKNNFVNTIK